MKKLLQGETAQRNVQPDAKAKTAVVDHSWKKSNESPRYQLRFSYDFSQCSEDEILRLATLWVNKDFQNRMRSQEWGEKELKAQEEKPIDVAEMYRETRRAADPKSKAKKALSALSEEERKALLKELGA